MGFNGYVSFYLEDVESNNLGGGIWCNRVIEVWTDMMCSELVGY